jgi:uncharacterized integral membrane protein
MRTVKVVLISLILLSGGILVGSNLNRSIATVVLSQKTIELPVGMWLISAIVVGFSGSLLVQMAIALQQQALRSQLRKLQLQTGDPDPIFVAQDGDFENDWESEEPEFTNARPSPLEEEEEEPEPEDDYIEPDGRGEVVDAGFRVIRPPETDDYPPERSPPPDRDSPRRPRTDEEDWGFNFDDRSDRDDRRRR